MDTKNNWVIHYQYYRISEGSSTPHVPGGIIEYGADNREFTSAEEALQYLNKHADQTFFQMYSFRNANVQNDESFYKINGAHPPFTLGPKCRKTIEGPVPIEAGRNTPAPR